MKIRNTTDVDTKMLRRMTSWCCKQCDVPVRYVKQAWFRNRSGAIWSGRAYYTARRIVVSTNPRLDTDEPGVWNMDRLEALVHVASHEIAHIATLRRERLGSRRTRRHGKGNGGSERAITSEENRIVKIFKNNRLVLEREWRGYTPITSSTAVAAITKRSR